MRTLASTRSFIRLSTTATLLSLTLLAAAPSRAGEPAIDTQDEAGVTRWDVYLSGYARHNRNTYTEAQMKKLNEHAWGGGLGRSTRDERGNEGAWYAIGIRDSNRRPQWMAGYAYQWGFSAKPNEGLELGVGATATIIRRHNWHEGRPFPALLPVASLGTRSGRMVATYVPRLSNKGKKNEKGDVLLVMFRLSL